MKKIIKKVISICISVSMMVTMAATTVSADTSDVSTYGFVTEPNEKVIVIDTSKAKEISKSEYMQNQSAARSSLTSLPYSDSVTLSSKDNKVTTPKFETNFSSNVQTLKFKPSSFKGGDKKIKLTINWYSEADERYMSYTEELEFNIIISYRLFFSGSVTTTISEAYFDFYYVDGNATSFKYEVSING